VKVGVRGRAYRIEDSASAVLMTAASRLDPPERQRFRGSYRATGSAGVLPALAALFSSSFFLMEFEPYCLRPPSIYNRQI